MLVDICVYRCTTEAGRLLMGDSNGEAVSGGYQRRRAFEGRGGQEPRSSKRRSISTRDAGALEG